MRSQNSMSSLISINQYISMYPGSYLKLFFLMVAIFELRTLAVIDGPFDYDQLMSFDVSHEDLLSKIGPALNISYLGKTQPSSFSQHAEGIIWGRGIRSFVNLPVRFAHPSCSTHINVIFKVDTGSPITTLTAEALDQLFKNCPQVQRASDELYLVKINDREFEVQMSAVNVNNFNILGANFMRKNNIRLIMDYSYFQRQQSLSLAFDFNVEKQQQL